MTRVILGVHLESVCTMALRRLRFSHSGSLCSSLSLRLVSTKPARVTSDEISMTDPSGPRVQKISNAMKVYMEKAASHAKFLKEKREEFELGKRHLANMMGWNPDTITQENIDEAIAYLLPTMLFDRKSRPMMKPPEEIYPKQKGALFDETGRPFHHLFYTGKPRYYESLNDIFTNFLLINDIDAKMRSKGVHEVGPGDFYDPTGTEWITRGEFISATLEEITENEYDYLIRSLDRLVKLPYSTEVKNFIDKFRKKLTAVSSAAELPPITLDEDGRAYAEAQGLRKHCKAHVRVYDNGTGQVSINGTDLSYFDFFKDREQIMFPLQMAGKLYRVDVVASVEGEGNSAQAGAVRHGISLALRPFISPEKIEEMRVAGLLTKDRRVCERKKYGQWAARRKFTWLKR